MVNEYAVYWLCLLLQLPALVVLLTVVLEAKLTINFEKLNLPKDVFKTHLKLSLPSRMAMAILGAALLAFLVSGCFVLWYKLRGGRISQELIRTIITGSALPFLATVSAINRLMKIKLAYRYVIKKFSNWIFIDALAPLAAFQVFFWLIYFNL